MNRENSTYLPDGPAIRGATDTLYSSEKIISLDISLEGREKLPKSIHTVVFDLDGTYIDNVKKFRTHFVVIAHQVFGVTRKEAALHFMANPHLPSREQVRTLAIKRGWWVESPTVKKAGEDLFERCSRQKGKLTPYAVRTSEWLRGEGMRVAINTGSREKDAENKIFGTELNKYVNVVVGSDSSLDGPTLPPGEPPVVKGDPQLIITARRLGFPAQDYEEEFKPGIVAVTDTPGDVLLFKAAGVSVFAIADYATTRVKMLRALSEFPISQYDQVASSLEHLRGHIERINFKAAVGDKTEVV